MTNSVTTKIFDTFVTKTADTPEGMMRIAGERRMLRHLADAGCVARELEYVEKNGYAEMKIEHIAGESLKSWIKLDDEWRAKGHAWKDAQGRLAQYVELETNLLERGVMYRDLNLDHVIFAEQGAYMIDLEASLLATREGEWMLDNQESDRGTWETMALEEFRRPVALTTRTATYRSAVVAHLALTGELPFARKPQKKDTHAWRASHVPELALDLSKAVRGVFASSLSREVSRRHKTPARFFEALTEAMDAG